MAVVPLCVALSAAAVAATTDIRRFKVYNLLTFPLAGCGLLYHSIAPSGIGLSSSALGLLVGFLLLILPYAAGALGAGDVKFVAAIGAWVGAESVLHVVMIGCVATGVYAGIVIFGRGGWKAVGKNIWFTCRTLISILSMGRIGRPAADDMYETLQQPDRRGRLVPFSAMQAIGVFGVAVTELVNKWPSWF